MRPTDALAVRRESSVVCVIAVGRTPSAQTFWRELAAHTPAEVPILLLATKRSELVRRADDVDRELLALEHRPGTTIAEELTALAALAAPADVVFLGSGCSVPSGWLERLRGAALSDDTVASATPLSSAGTTAVISAGRHADPDRELAAVSIRARPRILIGGPHCVYVRRRALDLLGDLAGAQGTLAATIADLSERCLHAGMVNVIADDLYLQCEPDHRPEPESESESAEALAEIDRGDERSALSRALLLAASRLKGLSVTIDARSLGLSVGGTQRYTFELVLALARFTDTKVRVVVGPDIGKQTSAQLQGTPGVEVISYDQAVAGVELSQIVHRPQQVFSAGDLNLLVLLGRRLVVTHQDLIAYHNPSYHPTLQIWAQHRRISRIALAAADRVVFFSEHSRRDAEAEDLVSEERSEVIGAALAGAALAGDVTRRTVAPRAAPRDREFILCLGSDYRHKNRCFAISVLHALRTEQGWQGRLVLAGGHVVHGSSHAEEQELLRTRELGEEVSDLGSVDEPERAWLLEHARAVIVPSVVEGFGLVPLEAAQAGVPCLFAAQSSLVEVIDPSLASLAPWDPSASAAQAIKLLVSGEPRRRHVERLRECAERWRWEQIAGQLQGCYERTLRSPFPAAAVRAWQELERESYIVELARQRDVLAERLRRIGDGIALASHDGFLTPQEQRGLLRVGSRPGLARAVLWPFGIVGSLPSRRSPQAR